MAFTDPLPNFTLATVAQTLPRVSTSGFKSIYRKADGSLIYTISHETKRERIRSVARVDEFLDVNSDLVLEQLAVYVVIDRPISGFSSTQITDLTTAHLGSLTASSNAAIAKLINTES